MLVFLRPFPFRTTDKIVLSISRLTLAVNRNVSASVKCKKRKKNVLLLGDALLAFPHREPYIEDPVPGNKT